MGESFLRTTDLSGKKIYSVVTHGGSGFGDSIKDTKKYTSAKMRLNT